MDSPRLYFFKPLIKQTAENFQLKEVSADKAYLGRPNMDLVDSVGDTPFIPFKSSIAVPKKDLVWTKVYHLFMLNREVRNPDISRAVPCLGLISIPGICRPGHRLAYRIHEAYGYRVI